MQTSLQYMDSISCIFCLLSLLIITHTISFPAAFTVVRNIPMPLNIDTFMNRTGCCRMDTNNNSLSYNIVSLDGFKATSDLNTLSQGTTPLGIWLNAFTSIVGSKAGRGGNNTITLQSYILDSYRQANARLLFNAFGDEAPISEAKSDPSIVAKKIINVIQASQLDGVSIEFNDFHSVAAGTASAWLSQLLTQLQAGLPKKVIVLILPVTIINKVEILQQPIINGLVNLFVLKYFGYNQPQYIDYNTIFNSSSKFPNTAFGELLKNRNVEVNLCRSVIAKPASSSVEGFINSVTLANIFMSARNNFGWFGGYANLDAQSDLSGNFQLVVMQQLRNDCLRQDNCFCT